MSEADFELRRQDLMIYPMQARLNGLQYRLSRSGSATCLRRLSFELCACEASLKLLIAHALLINTESFIFCLQ